jgi:hypothetical protein
LVDYHLGNENLIGSPAMNATMANTCEPIDGRTSRSICDAVGERLQRDLRPDKSGLSPYLQRLMEELERRDISRPAQAPSVSRASAG